MDSALFVLATPAWVGFTVNLLVASHADRLGAEVVPLSCQCELQLPMRYDAPPVIMQMNGANQARVRK